MFDTPHLIQSLATFAEQRANPPQDIAKVDTTSGTTLLLQVRASADYFTTNKTLMLHPEPVKVEIILDPYLLSIFPTSLLPTAVYLIALAIGGWYLSGRIWKFLQPNSASKAHVE